MSAFAQISGRLGQDPVLNYTNGGTPVVNLSVASNRQKKDAGGEKINLADWYRVSMFGRNAEIIAEYAKKGSALAFNGRLQVDSYVDREGIERTSVCLIADCFEFMPSAQQADKSGGMADETTEENRCAERARALAASASRFLGGAFVSSEFRSFLETAATSPTAARKAASLAFDGLLKPLNFRTNCSEAARISSSVTGGSKLKSILIFRHIRVPSFPCKRPYVVHGLSCHAHLKLLEVEYNHGGNQGVNRIRAELMVAVIGSRQAWTWRAKLEEGGGFTGMLNLFPFPANAGRAFARP
jgi:single-strand DNA-binding protein